MQESLFFTSGIGYSIMLLAATIAIGLCLGKLKIKGVSLGATWILFVGILFSHLLINVFGKSINPYMLHFMKEFGLILFVFSIGLQVGPGFFQSFKKGGMKMNMLAVSMVLLAVLVTWSISAITGEPLERMVGVMSGAVTNTPGLGAAQQTMTDVMNADIAGSMNRFGTATPEATAVAISGEVSSLSSGYAVAYPMGVIGVILVIMIVKAVFRIDLKKEKEELERDAGEIDSAVRIACEVKNPAVYGKCLKDIDHDISHRYVVSRICRNDEIHAPVADDRLEEGDRLLVVTSKSSVDVVTMLFGTKIEMDKEAWEQHDTSLVTKKLNVSKSSLTGVRLRDLNIRSNFGVSITRIDRSGMELVANPGLKLQMGDVLVVVGDEKAINKVAKLVGNSAASLRHPNLIPIFFGIALGIIFGSIPIAIPSVPQPIKIGLAGGPLIIAILIGHFGPKYKITTYTTLSANMMLREVGITIFLAAVGLSAGENFVSSITGGGYWWILYGALITIIPTLAIAVIGRLVFKLNFYQITGLVSGGCTNPPVLAFAQNQYGTDYTSVNYATVYPLSMFMRVLVAQMMVLLAIA